MKSFLRNFAVLAVVQALTVTAQAYAGQPGPEVAATPAMTAAQDSKELTAFKKAIRAKYDLKEKAFAENDADAIADHFYSKDVVSVDYEGKVTVGREALRAEYKEIVPTATVKVESVNTYVKGNAGWDWTNFYVTPTDPNEKPYSFVILFLWAKEKGEWICKGDMYVKGSI